MENKDLASAINDIRDAIENTLQAEISVDGGKLSEVKTLVIGNKTSVKPTTPALWVFFNSAIPRVDTTMLVCETWEMDIIVVGVVYNTNQDDGYTEANRLTAKAKRVLLADRTLGFGHGTFFNDIKSKSFDGNNPYFNQGNYFTAAYTCTVVFAVRE